MNAWVQWFMPDQKPPGQPDTGATSETVEPPVAARGNAGPGRPPSRVFRPTVSKPPEPPIRAELFSVERLEQHAESLAAAQRIAPNPKQGRPLAKRLYDNTKVLTETYRAIVRANSAHQPITPAAEWLLDNFHVVDEQIREIKRRSSAGLSTAGCRNWPTGRCRAIRASSASPGHSSPIPTARSTSRS